jgi:hypothetical protein
MNRRKPKTTYVSVETFAQIRESLEQALAYERGEREGYRVTRVEIPEQSQRDDRKQVARRPLPARRPRR